MRSGFCVVFSFFFIICTSCATPKLWGYSRDEILRSLERRDYSFLEGVDPSEYGKVARIGSEAPWYIGQHLAAAGRDAEARRMFLSGSEHSPEPFATLCLVELAGSGSPEERLVSVNALLAHLARGRASARVVPGNARPQGIAGIDVAFWENRRIELLLETGGTVSGDDWFLSRPMTASLAVAAERILSGSPDVAGIDAESREILAVRLLVFRRDYQGAWLKARPLLETRSRAFGHRAVLSDCGKAALYGSTDHGEDAAFLDALAGKAESDLERYILAFYAGRLYARSSGDPSAPKATMRSRARFVEAMKCAPDDGDFDTALWYLADLALKEGTESAGALAALDELVLWLPSARDPLFFTDILENLTVTFVRTGQWKSLVQLQKILPAGADAEVRTRLAYITARSGLLPPNERRNAFTEAFEGDHGSLYYRVLSADALEAADGTSPVTVPNGTGRAADQAAPIVSASARATGGEESDAAVAADKAAAEAAAVLGGFIEYGLPERMYAAASRLYPRLSLPLARSLAERLSAKGRTGDSVKIMALAVRSSPEPVTDDALRILYPRPWEAEVSQAARRFGVPEYLLYALVRSESLFQADIRSQAGAVGLSQLMRPTAADIAAKLGYAEYDLNDPGTNITFGAYYLSEMIRRLDGKRMPALFAYNAGITRVRSWQASAPDLSGDLFLESLPYAETREYGRKVLAAAVVYGYLYYQKSAGQIVRELF